MKGWLPAGSAVDLAHAANWETSEEPLGAEFAVKIPNFGTSTGRRLLFPLALFQVNEKNPFQSEKRVQLIYFQYPYQETDDISVQLPKGYQVESLPAARKAVSGAFQYLVTYENQAGRFSMRRHLAINGYFFRVESYPALRSFYSSVRAGDEQQAVLKTVEAAQQK